jgi:hypothetical protein
VIVVDVVAEGVGAGAGEVRVPELVDDVLDEGLALELVLPFDHLDDGPVAGDDLARVDVHAARRREASPHDERERGVARRPEEHHVTRVGVGLREDTVGDAEVVDRYLRHVASRSRTSLQVARDYTEGFRRVRLEAGPR